MKSTLMHLTPATGLSSHVALAQSITAPDAAAQGTGLSFAGSTAAVTAAAAQAVAVVTADVRTTDLPGSPPRGAPV